MVVMVVWGQYEDNYKAVERESYKKLVHTLR